LAQVFAAGWEAEDISLSSTNDIEVTADKSPDGKQKLGSYSLINNPKQTLLIKHVKEKNDLGQN